MYPLNEGITLQKILSEANIATKMWDGKDFASGALMMNPDKKLPKCMTAVSCSLCRLGSSAEYTLTDTGYSLKPILDAMVEWISVRPYILLQDINAQVRSMI